MTTALLANSLAMQPVALIFLVLYLAAVAILTPRELVFLREAPPPRRSWFIVQDVLLQISIMAVLVPCASTAELTLTRIVIVVGGFTVLWIVTVWMVVARQQYVHHLLREARREGERQLRSLSEQLKDEQEDVPSGDAVD